MSNGWLFLSLHSLQHGRAMVLTVRRLSSHLSLVLQRKKCDLGGSLQFPTRAHFVYLTDSFVVIYCFQTIFQWKNPEGNCSCFEEPVHLKMFAGQKRIMGKLSVASREGAV